MLATARGLTPDPSGMGTHRQLGLPACSSLALFGVRCPGCGMTTSWSLATRGRIAEAAAVNAGGLAWAVVAAAVAVGSAWSLATGWHPTRRIQWALLVAMMVAIAISIGHWIARWPVS